MKSACVGVLSIIELKNAQWNIEIITRGCWLESSGSAQGVKIAKKKKTGGANIWTVRRPPASETGQTPRSYTQHHNTELYSCDTRF